MRWYHPKDNILLPQQIEPPIDISTQSYLSGWEQVPDTFTPPIQEEMKTRNFAKFQLKMMQLPFYLLVKNERLTNNALSLKFQDINNFFALDIRFEEEAYLPQGHLYWLFRDLLDSILGIRTIEEIEPLLADFNKVLKEHLLVEWELKI